MLHFLGFWEEQPPSLTPSSGVRLNWALMVPEHCIVQSRDRVLVETDPNSGSWVMSYSDRQAIGITTITLALGQKTSVWPFLPPSGLLYLQSPVWLGNLPFWSRAGA